MTNRLELSWDVDGFIDEQHYYCSTSPMDAESLPEPKVILANDVRSYIDTDIIEGQLYYVRVGSVKNGIVKVSNEISLLADKDQYWSNVTALLHFDDNLADEKGNTWTISGSGLSYTASSVNFGKKLTKADVSTGKVTCSNAALGELGYDDFTIEFKLYLPSRTSNPSVNFAWLITTDNVADPGARGWQIVYEYTSGVLIFASAIRSSSGTTLDYAVLTTSSITLNAYHHIAVTRSGDTFKLFVDGVQVAQVTKHATMNSGIPVFVGKADNNIATQACFSIDELRITKGVARYTANFTPPTKPFLNL